MADGRDDFWDLSKLLPNKKKTVPPPPVQVATANVEAGKDVPGDPERKLHFATRREEAQGSETFFYVPEGNPLITKVTVTHRTGGFSYYHRFRLNAERYLREEGHICEYVPFFSFVPQYSQLDESQLQYYFYWRQCAKAGNFIRCDASYLYLFFYEVINLPDLIPPEEGVRLLASVWAAYREKFPKITPYMAAWMVDYCLIHRQKCPGDLLRLFLSDILAVSTMKEFYLGFSDDLSLCKVDALIALASDYNWRAGRYATGENEALFETHIRASARLCIARLLQDGTVETPYARTSKRYDAFCGSLCAQNVKCTLEVEYYPISHTESLRRILTAAIKYAENRLRAHLAIKSRLTVPAFPAEYREIVDRYFDGALPKASPPPREIPAYERQYDAVSQTISFEDAARIEELSWDNTRRLVPEEENEVPVTKAVRSAPMPAEKTEQIVPAEPVIGNKPENDDPVLAMCAFLRAAERKDAAAERRAAAEAGMTAEALFARINEYFYEELGDAVLEDTGAGYQWIPDYREEVSEWLQKNERK